MIGRTVTGVYVEIGIGAKGNIQPVRIQVVMILTYGNHQVIPKGTKG